MPRFDDGVVNSKLEKGDIILMGNPTQYGEILAENFLVEDITRANLQTLISASELVRGKCYRVTNAVGSTLSLIVQALTANTITDVAYNTINGDLYTYNITADTATQGIVSDVVDFDPQTAPAYLRGRVWYDSDTESLSYYDDISGTSNQIGKEEHVRVRNTTGVTIANGSVVYVSGATGQIPQITLAQANADGTSNVIGIATHEIANNAFGKVTTFGVVNDVNTLAFAEGSILYLSQSVAGGLTSTRPSAPNFAVIVGICLHSHATQGKILVNTNKQGLGFGTANQLLGINAGATGQEYKTLNGTTSQVVVTNASGSITLSLPQSIATNSSVQFGSLALTTALGVASGGTGLSTTPTNGQLLIGNGTNYTLSTLTGTANQVTVTNGAGSITLSLPQSIATTSTPQFAGLGLGSTNIINLQGISTTAKRYVASGTDFDTSHSITARYSADASGAAFALVKSRAASIGTNTLVQNGDSLGNIDWFGADGSSYYRGARISAIIDGTPGSADMPGAIVLSTTPDGSTSVLEAMRITSSQNVLIGTTSNPSSRKLLVSGTAEITGAVTLGTALGVASGGTGLNTTPTNGQIDIGNGTGFTRNTLTGTANQVVVTNGSGSITLSLPQSIATTSTPQFARLGIGTASLATTSLAVQTNLTGGTSAFGIAQFGVVQSGVTSFATSYYSELNTAASVFNIDNYIHFRTFQNIIGAGSTITTQVGFSVSGTLTGATNNYGFRGSIPSGSGRWNIYMDGTAANYMAGNVQIGSATPTAGAEKLQVTGTASVSGNTTIGGTLGITGAVTGSSTAQFTRLGLGGVPVTGSSIAISGSLTGAATSYNLALNNSVQSDVTNAFGVDSISNTQATSFTLSNYTHFRSSQGTFGAGSTVTTQTGFFANSSLIGATNNYGFRGAIPSGTNRWNLYMSGTAANHIQGDTLIGTTTAISSAKLVVTSTTQGFLPPRMTTAQRDAIATPEAGLMIYNTTTNKLNVYTTAWEQVTSA